MNRYITNLLVAGAVLGFMTSCLDEVTPTNMATQGQVNKADKVGLSNAVGAYMTTYNSDFVYDIGFAGFGIWRDRMTADLPVNNTGYDYFSYPGFCTWLGGGWQLQYTIWQRYYYLIQKANLVLLASDVESDPADGVYAANALAYRANAYLEMAQWYEYRPTYMGNLDQEAENLGIMGLTVPIVTETTTEAESRNNPRVPFYKIYRFILDDLDRAEQYMDGQTPLASVSNAGLGVIYGLKARTWLYLGTRFALHNDDLDSALSHEDDTDIPFAKLGISTSKDCFAKAAEYARKAINQGYTPLSENQWFDPQSGFNSVNNAWLWAIIISPDNGLAKELTYSSFVSFMSPEATYGVSDSQYGSYNMIDARLFSSIPDADWRKTTWIAPADKGNEKAFNTKYARGTSMSYNEWSDYNAYCGFKFHPNGGDRNTSTNGNAVSIPLMRVEEMYLIEAEAVGRANGEGAGRALLESFVNTYRYSDGSYKSTGAGLEGFINDVFTQKRIEFWGEGLILWDYRRLEKAMTRGYAGTNFPALYRFNSQPNAVAPWSTLSIPQLERDFNPAVILNPDPSQGTNYTVWEE